MNRVNTVTKNFYEYIQEFDNSEYTSFIVKPKELSFQLSCRILLNNNISNYDIAKGFKDPYCVIDECELGRRINIYYSVGKSFGIYTTYDKYYLELYDQVNQNNSLIELLSDHRWRLNRVQVNEKKTKHQ